MTDTPMLTVRLGKIAHGGHTVARHEGRVIFVRHGIPGELVKVRLTDSAPQAGSKPEQRGDRNDRTRMAQQQGRQEKAPAAESSMAAAFAKLRG